MRPQAGKRVEAPSSAFPRALPRDAARGIPREPARQDASRTPQSTEAYSTSFLSSRPGSARPLHKERDVPPAQKTTTGKDVPRPSVERPLRGVRQDKYALTRVRRASLQAVTAEKDARTRRADPTSARSPSKRQTVQVAAWIKPALRAELETIARKNGLTLSRTIASLLEEAIRQQLHVQHAVLLQPIIEQAIARQMRAYSGRIAVLLVRSLFASEQTRGLVTNILGRQPGITQPVLRDILNSAGRSAKRNITQITPQLAGLVEEIKEWMEKKEADDTHV
jgi:hypothetical protein